MPRHPIIGAKLKKAGEQYSFVGPADFGIQFVANSVVTSKKMFESRPDTVKPVYHRTAPGLA